MLEIRNFFELTLIISIFSLVVLRKINLLQAYAFFIPFYGIDYDVGVRYTISQLILLILNVLFFISIFSKTDFIKLKGLNTSIILFLLYAFVSSFLLSTFLIEFIPTKNSGFLRNEGRYISQIINYSLLFSIFYIIYYNINTKKEVIILLKYFLFGIITISSIGILQEIIYITIGIDITPLYREDYSIRNAAIFNYFGLPLIRINSLAGEPKSLGMFASIGIIILKVLRTLNIKLFNNQFNYSVLFFITLILTLSSSGFLLLALLWVLSEIILRYFKMIPSITIGKFFSWILTGIFIIVFSDSLDNIINDRITEREKIEDFDAVIIESLKYNPKYLVFGSGLGNIHNIAYKYTGQFENLNFMEDNIFVAKSGYLRIISETGIIGFFLFLIFNGQTILSAFVHYYQNKFTIMALFASLSVIAFISFLARTYLTEFYLFTMAATNVLIKKQLF